MDYIVGFLVALLVSMANGPLLRRLEREIRSQYNDAPPPHSLFTQEQWEREVLKRTKGGWWLGKIEVLIFFASFATRWELAAAWLVLKAASKWKSWTTTSDALKSAPDSTREARLQDARSHLARTALDHRLFLVGTGLNIVAGLLGAAVAFQWGSL